MSTRCVVPGGIWYHPCYPPLTIACFLVPKALHILMATGAISTAVLTGRWLGCHYPDFILRLLGAGGEHTFHSTHLGVRDSLKEPFLSFHRVGPGDQIQILEPGVKCLSLLNNLTGSYDSHFIGDKGWTGQRSNNIHLPMGLANLQQSQAWNPCSNPQSLSLRHHCGFTYQKENRSPS